VVIDDFDIERLLLLVGPFEANAPLEVDADAVLTGAIAFQRFEVIAPWRHEVEELRGGVEPVQRLHRCPQRHALKPSDVFAACESLCVAVAIFRPQSPSPRRC
jgi:hypothetical protein